jgi:hypothetical protein
MTDVFVEKARWIPRAIDPFLNLTITFQVGIAEDGQERGLEPDEEVDDLLQEMYVFPLFLQGSNHCIHYRDPNDRTAHLRCYREILRLVPGFRNNMDSFEENSAALRSLLAQV